MHYSRKEERDHCGRNCSRTRRDESIRRSEGADRLAVCRCKRRWQLEERRKRWGHCSRSSRRCHPHPVTSTPSPRRRFDPPPSCISPLRQPSLLLLSQAKISELAEAKRAAQVTLVDWPCHLPPSLGASLSRSVHPSLYPSFHPLLNTSHKSLIASLLPSFHPLSPSSSSVHSSWVLY